MRSLKRAFLGSILTGVSGALLLAGASVYLTARGAFRSGFDAMLIERANTLGALVIDEEGVLEFEYDQPLDEEHVGVLARITGADGTTVAQSEQWPLSSAPSPLLPSAEPMFSEHKRADGTRLRVMAVTRTAVPDPVPGESDPPPASNLAFTVEVAARLDDVHRAETAVLSALLFGGVLALLGSAAAIWLGVRRGLVPVQHLGEAVDEIDATRLGLTHHRTTYPEELRPIVTALEGLLERLQAALERERRFTDAAAHELRTPLAELRTITDVADRWPEPERLQRSIRDARTVMRQMEDLLESLLAAARGAAVHPDQPAERLRLRELACGLVRESQERLARLDVQCRIEGDEEATWIGPRGVILALLRNVIDNAVEYTPSGGSIVVRTRFDERKSVIEIENGPVDLPAAEVERIFEPFWRADPARSGRKHQGLGLTIVRSLAETIEVELNAAVDTSRRFRLHFSQEAH